MADGKGSDKKSKLLFVGGLVLTGLLTCGAGVAIGLWVTGQTPAVVNDDQPTPSATPSAPNEPPAMLSENTQTFETIPEDEEEPVAAFDTDVDETTTEPKPFDDAPPTLPQIGSEETQSDPLSNHIAMADEELRGGSFAQALRTYQFAFEHARGLAKAAVLYRMGLCSESAGNFHDAANRYKQITRSFSTTPWAAIGRLGEARCLAALGRVDTLASGVLRPALLDQTVFSPTVRAELLHVCGRGYCQAFMPEGLAYLLDDVGMVMPLWTTDPNRQLDMLPQLLKGEALPARSTVFEVLQQTDRIPDSTFLRTHTAGSDVTTLIQAVVERSGFEFHITPSAQAAIADRTQHLYADDINLGHLLDGLSVPFGLLWWHDESGIHVAVETEAEHAAILAFRRKVGIRLLQNALVSGPDSHQAGYSRVSLGVLQFQHQSAIDAAYTFQSQMEIDPRSEVEAEAAFNLGKCYLASGQMKKARDAFLKAVDSATHNPDAAVGAYLYVGRLQIEEGTYQSAVSSMVRALALCDETELEPHAALLLASAYLMADSPEGANSVLMKRREEFATHERRNAGAFLSAYAKFKRAVLPGPRERAGRGLVTALTRFRPGQQFGSHWLYLHARACEDLGLTENAISGFTETIKRLPAAGLRRQAMVKLAAQYRFDKRLDEAATLLAGISNDTEDTLGQQITMQAAMVALDNGDGQTVVRHCRHIVESVDDPELQRAALQLMGKGYELQQNHRAAVYCFAGMLPTDEMSTVPQQKDTTDEPIEPPSQIRRTGLLRDSRIDFSDDEWSGR